MYLIHGDNTIASRTHLNQLIDQHKGRGVSEIIRLNGKKITDTDLIQALETQSLFGQDKLVVIEDLLARPRSQAKAALTSYLKTTSTPPNTPEVILWESKAATPAQIKSVGNPKNQHHKLSKLMFSFLENLRPNQPKPNSSSLQQTLQQEPAELIFALLIRQIRLLIQVKDNAQVKLPPWQVNKLKSQSATFSLSSLQKLHQDMIQIDMNIKTGSGLLPLDSQLDILVTKL